MNAKEWISGVYLDTRQFTKEEVINLMEEYHIYKNKFDEEALKKSSTNRVKICRKINEDLFSS